VTVPRVLVVTVLTCFCVEMGKQELVESRVRLAIAQWPDDAPRGSVTTFCLEHGISRKTFYVLRARALQDGPDAVLVPRSRRPKTSPTRLDDQMTIDALRVRATLEASGLDHGPISVRDKMLALDLPAPSVASLARIFRAQGVARFEPKKKPRAAYRRFVYPAPNACWQLDGTQYRLKTGESCVIFQLIDDHSRLAVASLAAVSENSADAVTVVKNAIARHGVPQRLLTDNGAALNPHRRGFTGELTAYVTSLGVEAITGKPYSPTTQGKNERFHQTLFRWLDQQPHASTLKQLQTQLDEFDHIYNTMRPHQGLPGRVTPQQAWDATPIADPPRPPATPYEANMFTKHSGPNGEGIRKVKANGCANAAGTEFMISCEHAGSSVHAQWTPTTVTFTHLDTGEVLASYPRPPRGTKNVGSGKPRGWNARRTKNTEETSPKS